MHAVSGQVESQSACLRMQLDDDAGVVILKIGDRTAGADRQPGRNRRIIAVDIRRFGEIVDLALGRNARAADISDRDSRQFEVVLLLIFAVVESPVAPGVTNTNGNGAAVKSDVTGRYGTVRNGRRGAAFCRHHRA